MTNKPNAYPSNQKHRQNVSVPFDKLVTDRQGSHADTAQDEQEVADITVELESILTEENLKLREQFWNSKLVANLSEEARERLDNAYPLMARALIKHEKETGQANIAVPRLITLLEAICRRSVYLVMLAENPKATIDLIPMLSASPWIANELALYPVLLDTFLQQKYYHLPDKAELRDIMRQRLLRVEPGDESRCGNPCRTSNHESIRLAYLYRRSGAGSHLATCLCRSGKTTWLSHW